ncbi:MAG TPA: ABC transporter substrate-binding protein, partial [Candidatus Krumholzibacteria bacterium]|nr:ABC transporter substrate-binding protein [Candidatus Krumholzibacteria bacterium]
RGPAMDAATLVVGTRAEPKTLNPIAITASESQQIAALLFQKLLEEQDDFMSFKPQLARSWSFSADSLDVTFVLRDDARWSDGEPVTASDVRFTWQVETDTTVAWPSASIKEHIRDVEVKDAHTVVFHFDKRSLYQLMDANDGVILPGHLLASIARHDLKTAPFGRAPVGNGPYVLSRWDAGQLIELSRNAKYAGTAPRIERVVVKFVPDAVTLVAQLQAGEIDLLESVQAADLAGIKAKRDDVQILDAPSRRMTFVAWNGARAPFDNVAVRTAMTAGIDRRAIIENVWGGRAKECTSPIVPLLWAYDPSIKAVKYDAKGAREALEKLGWRDRNGDGVLDRDRKPFEFELLVNDAQNRVDIATMIQAQLKKSGVKVNVRVMEYGAYIDRILAMDYDAAVVEWKVQTKVDLTQLFATSAKRPSGYNFIGYSNARVDGLIGQALAERDMKRARQLWSEAQRAIYNDQPYTFIAVPDELTAVDDRFCNLKPSPISIFAHITDWRVCH